MEPEQCSEVGHKKMFGELATRGQATRHLRPPNVSGCNVGICARAGLSNWPPRTLDI